MTVMVASMTAATTMATNSNGQKQRAMAATTMATRAMAATAAKALTEQGN